MSLGLQNLATFLPQLKKTVQLNFQHYRGINYRQQALIRSTYRKFQPYRYRNYRLQAPIRSIYRKFQAYRGINYRTTGTFSKCISKNSRLPLP